MNTEKDQNKELNKNDVSSRLSIQEIKERLDKCIDLYTDLFCKKQCCDEMGWIGNIKGGINCFDDAGLRISDIKEERCDNPFCEKENMFIKLDGEYLACECLPKCN